MNGLASRWDTRGWCVSNYGARPAARTGKFAMDMSREKSEDASKEREDEDGLGPAADHSLLYTSHGGGVICVKDGPPQLVWLDDHGSVVPIGEQKIENALSAGTLSAT